MTPSSRRRRDEGGAGASRIAGSGDVEAGARAARAARRAEEQEEDELALLELKSRGPMLLVPGRTVNLYVFETLWFLVDYLQLLACFWSAGRAWKWPFWFLRSQRWTLVFSIERWRQYTDPAGGALVVRPSPFSYYGWMYFWLCAPFALWFLYRFVSGLRYFTSRTERGLHTVRAHIDAVFLFAAEAMYFPWAVNLFTMFSCGLAGSKDGREVLSTDYSVVCGTASHIILIIVGSALGLGYLVGFPLLVARRISASVLFPRPKSYERSIRLAEFEYLTGLSDQYSALSMHIFASYRRYWTMYRPFNLFHKLLVAVLFWGLWTSPRQQALTILITLVAPVPLQLLFVPHRRPLANVVLLFSRLILAVQVLFGYLAASLARSAILVSSVLYFVMVGFNVILLGIYCLEIFISVYFRATWPVQRLLIQQEADLHSLYVSAIERARDMCDRYYGLENFMFVNTADLGDAITRLERYRKRAKRDDLAIEGSLANAIEDLIAIYNVARSQSVLPFPQLEALLPALRDRLDRRDYELLLLPRIKKNILFKLFAIRAWYPAGAKPRRPDGPVEAWAKRSDPDGEPFAAAVQASQPLKSRGEREAALLKQSVLREVFAEDEDEDSMDAYFRNMGVKLPAIGLILPEPPKADAASGRRPRNPTPEPLIDMSDPAPLVPSLAAPPILDLTAAFEDSAKREKEREKEKEKEEEEVREREKEKEKEKVEKVEKVEEKVVAVPVDKGVSPSDDEANEPALYAAKTARLQATRKELRAKIKEYETNFEKENGRKVTHDDKRKSPGVVEMFKAYKEVSTALEARDKKDKEKEKVAAEPVMTPAPVAPAVEAAPPATAVEPAPAPAPAPAPTPTPAPAPVAFDAASEPPSEPADLLAFTEAALAAVPGTLSGAPSSPSKEAMAACLTKTRSLWKKTIRGWEKDWAAKNGSPPQQADKQQIKPWYAMEKSLKAALGQLEPAAAGAKED